jgi:hypothetical protein
MLNLVQILYKMGTYHPPRVPEYPRTRTRGTRVPAAGTGMRRVGYSFEKKTSTRARCTRLPVPAVPAARTRGTRRQMSTVR